MDRYMYMGTGQARYIYQQYMTLASPRGEHNRNNLSTKNKLQGPKCILLNKFWTSEEQTTSLQRRKWLSRRLTLTCLLLKFSLYQCLGHIPVEVEWS